jgi:hypothetical protein
MNKVFLVLCLALLLVSCGGASEGEIQTAIAETESARPTEADTPSVENISTDMPKPSDTAVPTNTPRPTNTSQPTNTPTETPTNTPEPKIIIFTGSGDSVVDLIKDDWPAILHITGNDASNHFAIRALDNNNELIDGLVNEIDPYDGYLPLDFREGEKTVRFQVIAKGEWKIEVLPIMAHFADNYLDVPGVFEGSGENIFLLVGDTPDKAIISGNEVGAHFAVRSYGHQSGMDILVNEIEPYNGTVVLAADTLMIQVKGKGNWSIEVTSK